MGWMLLTLLAAAVRLTVASETSFSVHDDLFAFPQVGHSCFILFLEANSSQYEVAFDGGYILLENALILFDKSETRKAEAQQGKGVSVNAQAASTGDEDSQPHQEYEYELMTLHEQPYLCSIPIVQRATANTTEEQVSEAEAQKELARAADKGRELLAGMQGNQCLFYSTGWWTYSFCYNQQVRQFHALSPGQTGGRVWPPQEDPTTPAFVLGKVDDSTKQPGAPDQETQHSVSTELQTKAETSYLVQQLSGGTPCDLTGKDRRIEIEYHCNPQLTDRIGWIKETSTCSYLMVVYTPRLCSDVAFLPPKETRAHPITCQEILTESQIPGWEELRQQEASGQLLDQAKEQILMVGDMQVGGMKYFKDGKRIERGRIVLTQDERAETIAMQKDGIVSSVSKADLKKLELDPADLEKFRQELQKLAGSKDWKIERLDNVNGQVQLRGVVSEDEKAVAGEEAANTETSSEQPDGEPEQEMGSEEEFKEEL
jgi:hypothetical protein